MNSFFRIVWIHSSHPLLFPTSLLFSGHADLVFLNASESGGTQVVTFARALNTGDPLDVVVVIATQDFIWAHGVGSADAPQQHAMSDRGNVCMCKVL